MAPGTDQRRQAGDRARRVASAATTTTVAETTTTRAPLDELCELARDFDASSEGQDATVTARLAEAFYTRAAQLAPPDARPEYEAVARYYFKLLAIKDEYEVARLYAETDFAKRVATQFEGDYKLNFHLAPPIFNKPDAVTGVPKKSTYGPWMMKAFGTLAKMRKYRGTALDIFGKTEERRRERALIAEYEKVVDDSARVEVGATVSDVAASLQATARLTRPSATCTT